MTLVTKRLAVTWTACVIVLGGLVRLYLDLPLKSATCVAGADCESGLKQWVGAGVVLAAAALPVASSVILVGGGGSQIRSWHGGRIALLWLAFALAGALAASFFVSLVELTDVRPPHPAALAFLGMTMGAVIASLVSPICITWIWLGRTNHPEKPPSRNVSGQGDG